MESIKAANLALRFLLELCLLAAFSYWGYQVGGGSGVKLALAVVLPLATAIVWGACLSPKAAVALPPAARLALEIVLFGLAVAALATTGHAALAVALAVVFSVNRALIYVWKQ